MTDPERVNDVVVAAEQLPRGAAIIYRHFGSAHRFVDAAALRQLTFERGQQLLIGDDPELAIEVGADGVHFRRDAKLRAPTVWRQDCPEWLISMAGMKSGRYAGDLSVLDGLLISCVFPSQSPSAGEPIGVDALAQKTRALPVPIFALGGINSKTAPELIGSGAAGIAGIGFLQKTHL